jgi:hypothetical protein
MLIHHPANSGWLVNKTGAMPRPRAYAEFSHKLGAILFFRKRNHNRADENTIGINMQ